MKLGHQIGLIWQFVAGGPETLTVLGSLLDEGAEVVLGDGGAGGQVLGEVRLVAVAEGCFPVGELAVEGVEGLRTST